MSKKSPPKPVKDLTYEEAFAELDSIMTALEEEQAPLDEAMRLFERGQALVRHCGALLEQAELKVHKLSAEGVEEFDMDE